jgi:protein arginine N-methyltransferase 1
VYSLTAYGRMIADPVRIGAYDRALQAAIRPDSVVLDIGAGTGILSLLACRHGALRVYAVEPSNAIAVARDIARANGMADRIEFIQAMSTAVTLPEPVHVVASDLHGVLPLLEQLVPSLIDARDRLLRPGGVLIPQCETLWAALVDACELYDRLVEPWAAGRLGFTMEAARSMVVNSWTKASIAKGQLLSEPRCWGSLDYSAVLSTDVSGRFATEVTRSSVAHGLCVWFDAQLFDGIEVSNAPGRPETIYGQGFFPFSFPVHVEAGDTVEATLRASLVGSDYVWAWDTRISRGETPTVADFHQSTFLGSPLALDQLHKRSSEHTPALTEEGAIDLYILQSMNGRASLDELARALTVKFPGRFASDQTALTRVAELSEKYSRA